MIATPEQYRTLADLIERWDTFGVIMVGHDMFVAMGKADTAPFTRIRPDGTFVMPKYVESERLQ